MALLVINSTCVREKASLRPALLNRSSSVTNCSARRWIKMVAEAVYIGTETRPAKTPDATDKTRLDTTTKGWRKSASRITRGLSGRAPGFVL